jgi:hypothetical protein
LSLLPNTCSWPFQEEHIIKALGRARKTFEISGHALNVPPAAEGFPQIPLTEEFETQEVREQLYICEVLHVVS